MDYRIAKQIRGAKFSDLMAANIVKGGSTMGSFKKAISQKSKAKAARFKEKFDPLNIAKFLTGGSKLAPAILGRLLGRSQRDIEYFSGTAKLIGGKATRIGTVEKQGSELGILTDIYKFLKKSYEYDKKQKDLRSDFAEESKLEDERRHKELLDAIRGAKTYTPMVEKEKAGGGFFDMIKSMFEALKNSIGGLVRTVLEKMFGGAKVLGNLLKFLGSRVFGLLLGPLAIAGTIGTLVLLLAEAIKLAIGNLPEFEKTIDSGDLLNYLQTASDYDKQKLANSFRRGIYGMEEKAVGGVGKAEEILASGNEKLIKAAGGRELLQRVIDNAEVKPTSTKVEPEKVSPRPISAPGTDPALSTGAQKMWDRQYGGKYNPITGEKLMPGETPPNIVPPVMTTPAPQTPAPAAAETMGGKYNRMSGASTTPMQMPSAGTGSNLTPAVNQNQNLRLDERMTSNAPPVSRPATVATPKVSSVVQRQPIPPVRNMEESFQRMIYNSIRVV